MFNDVKVAQVDVKVWISVGRSDLVDLQEKVNHLLLMDDLKL